MGSLLLSIRAALATDDVLRTAIDAHGAFMFKTVTPIIPDLNARADNGQNYQVLWRAHTSARLCGASLSQGNEPTGKVYFDVTGAPPTRVTNNGAEDLLIWAK
jgi:hypothetical protein